MSDNLQDLYNTRFSDEEKKHKKGIWVEICSYIKRVFGTEEGIIVDVAAGYCDFINNYASTDNQKKYAIDLNPDVSKYADASVTTICDGIEKLDNYWEEGTVSLFFMSNFLEHITKEQIRTLLSDEYRLLKKGGKLLIMTPNIKYVGGKYWDFFDHITPITDKAIIEAAEVVGYKLVKDIERFMPFTTKSKIPQAQWMVRAYLRLMPLSGRFMGEQSLIMFEKD